MAEKSFNLVPRRSKKTNNVIADNFEVLIPDIKFLGETIQMIAAHEIKEQMKIGNDPKNLIVDNQDFKPFNQAETRVVALFSDHKMVAVAARAVIRELLSVTRKLTGKAKASYKVMVGSTDSDHAKTVISNASIASLGILEKIAEGLPPNGRIIIAGPMVDYGRKLYWNPYSTRKLKGRARYKVYYDEFGKVGRINAKFIAGEREKRNTNMRDLVIGRVRRKYKGVIIYGKWVTGHSVAGDNRWPGIGIGLRSKGLL